MIEPNRVLASVTRPADDVYDIGRRQCVFHNQKVTDSQEGSSEGRKPKRPHDSQRKSPYKTFHGIAPRRLASLASRARLRLQIDSFTSSIGVQIEGLLLEHMWSGSA